MLSDYKGSIKKQNSRYSSHTSNHLGFNDEDEESLKKRLTSILRQSNETIEELTKIDIQDIIRDKIIDIKQTVESRKQSNNELQKQITRKLTKMQTKKTIIDSIKEKSSDQEMTTNRESSVPMESTNRLRESSMKH